MGEHVRLEVNSLCAGKAALFAGKRFLTSVGELMPLQSDSFSTLVVAAEGLLPTMLQRVLFEDTSCCAGEVALLAGKRFLTSVG